MSVLLHVFAMFAHNIIWRIETRALLPTDAICLSNLLLQTIVEISKVTFVANDRLKFVFGRLLLFFYRLAVSALSAFRIVKCVYMYMYQWRAVFGCSDAAHPLIMFRMFF